MNIPNCLFFNLVLKIVYPSPLITTTKTMASTNVISTQLAHAQIKVVPLGKRLCLDGWTAEQVKEASISEGKKRAVCWHDCHEFTWQPCRIPTRKDPRFNVYYSYGTFCSWSCAKAFCLQGRRCTGVSNISLAANKLRRLHHGQRSTATNGIIIKNLPPRHKLQMFGGTMHIDEYREGTVRFDGTLTGEELWGPPVPQREDIVPPSFIDESIVHVVRCTTAGGIPRNLDSLSAGGSSIFQNKSVIKNNRHNQRHLEQYKQGVIPTGGSVGASEGLLRGRDEKCVSGVKRKPRQMTLEQSMNITLEPPTENKTQRNH